MTIQTLKDEDFLPVAKGLIHFAAKSIYISTFKAEINAKPRGRKLADFSTYLLKKPLVALTCAFLFRHVKTENIFHLQMLKLYTFYLKQKSKLNDYTVNDYVTPKS